MSKATTKASAVASVGGRSKVPVDAEPSPSTEQVYIVEIQKLSTEDGPGIRTTIFFKNCPLRCKWCQNPETLQKKPSIQWFKAKCIGCETCIDLCPNHSLVFDDNAQELQIDRYKCQACGRCAEACPATALKAFGEWWSVDELVDEVMKDEVYYQKSGGGVTVSGGEPVLQLQWVIELLRRLKRNGIKTALDTCGYVSRTALEKVLPYVDIVLYDIKEIDPQKHERITGVTNGPILKNAVWLAKRLAHSDKQLWIRTPIIPRYTATEENIRGIATFIVQKLRNRIERWDLLAFNNLAQYKYHRMDLEWELASDRLFTSQEMDHYHAVAIQAGVKNAKWSGMTREPGE